MSDPNLTAALRGTLKLVEDADASGAESPLREVDPGSVNELLGWINDKLVEGMPEAITDAKLEELVDFYRAQGYRWAQEEERKRTEGRKTRKKSIAEAIDIEL